MTKIAITITMAMMTSPTSLMTSMTSNAMISTTITITITITTAIKSSIITTIRMNINEYQCDINVTSLYINVHQCTSM